MSERSFLIGERTRRWGRNIGIAIAFGLLYFLERG
jgi:hypothetical protein